MKIVYSVTYFLLGFLLPNFTNAQSLAELAKMAGIDLKEIGAEHMLGSSASSSPSSSMPYGGYPVPFSSSPIASSASATSTSSSASCTNCGRSGCPGCQGKGNSYASSSSAGSAGYGSYPLASSMGQWSQYPDSNAYGLGGGVEALSALSSVYSPSMNGFGGPFGGYGSPEANFIPAAAFAAPMMSPYAGVAGLPQADFAGEAGPSGYGASDEQPESGPRGSRHGPRENDEREYSSGRPSRGRPGRPSNGEEESRNESRGPAYPGPPPPPPEATSYYHRPSEPQEPSGPSSGGDFDQPNREYHRPSSGPSEGRGRNYDYE